MGILGGGGRGGVEVRGAAEPPGVVVVVVVVVKSRAGVGVSVYMPRGGNVSLHPMPIALASQSGRFG